MVTPACSPRRPRERGRELLAERAEIGADGGVVGEGFEVVVALEGGESTAATIASAAGDPNGREASTRSTQRVEPQQRCSVARASSRRASPARFAPNGTQRLGRAGAGGGFAPEAEATGAAVGEDVEAARG